MFGNALNCSGAFARVPLAWPVRCWRDPCSQAHRLQLANRCRQASLVNSGMQRQYKKREFVKIAKFVVALDELTTRAAVSDGRQPMPLAARNQARAARVRHEEHWRSKWHPAIETTRWRVDSPFSTHVFPLAYIARFCRSSRNWRWSNDCPYLP